MDPVAQRLFDYLKNALYNPAEAHLDPKDIPEEFRDFAKGLLYYVQSVREASILAADIARGDLDTRPLTTGNEVAPGLKSLQATLRHLTWQTQQIAKGDYQQRINFMGDFSEAINNMVVQLDWRQKALEEEIRAGIRKSQALALNLGVLEDITRQMPQLVLVLDVHSKEKLFQNHPIERVLQDRTSAEKLFAWIEDSLTSIGSDERSEKEIELISEGNFQFFAVDIRALKWGSQDAAAFIFTDQTQTRRAMASLQEIANYDQQTGVYSRHFGMLTLNKWLDHKQDFVLCFADMDSLKYVNDVFGHNEGDRYILEVASLLRLFSEGAFVCRLGGDEFMLLAKDWEQEAAEQRLEELRCDLIKTGKEIEPRYRHSVSYGVIKVDADNKMPLSDLLGLADERMYHYKKAHKAERRN
ncbi:MAG TPA: hypothetical protein DEB24_03330 [Coriobacteriia bacterium]|nr:hypothetical protein [Coriobacteriia bacterium]